MKKLSRKKIIAFSLIPALVLLVFLELAYRVKYAVHHRDPNYLVMPFKLFNNTSDVRSLEKETRKREPEVYNAKIVHYNNPYDDPLENFARPGKNWYYKFRPGSYHHVTYGNQIVYSINSLGFRGRDFLVPKPSGVFRIFVLGGSSTAGLESPDNDTFPAVLEGLLNEKYAPRKFEVINAGFTGYYSHTTLNLLRHELVGYQPDLILIYSAFNDKMIFRNIVHSRRSAILSSIYRLLYYKSMLYTALIEKLSVYRHQTPVPFVSHSFIENYTNRLKDIVAVSRKQCIEVAFVLQLLDLPHDYFLKRGGDNKDGMVKYLKTHGGLSYDDIDKLKQRVLVRTMEELGHSAGIPVIDPIPALEEARKTGTRPLFYDVLHLTPAGNRLLATNIARHLNRDVLTHRSCGADAYESELTSLPLSQNPSNSREERVGLSNHPR